MLIVFICFNLSPEKLLSCSLKRTGHWIVSWTGMVEKHFFYKTLFLNKYLFHLLCVFHFQEPSCDCLHNTCGTNCDRCCPLYNQRPWKSGPTICEQCQCHGHATECQYDPIIAEQRSSLDIYGTYSGGGICINCMVSIKYVPIIQYLWRSASPRISELAIQEEKGN